MKIIERTSLDDIYTDVVENYDYKGNRKTFGEFVRNLINSNHNSKHNYYFFNHKIFILIQL